MREKGAGDLTAENAGLRHPLHDTAPGIEQQDFAAGIDECRRIHAIARRHRRQAPGFGNRGAGAKQRDDDVGRPRGLAQCRSGWNGQRAMPRPSAMTTAILCVA